MLAQHPLELGFELTGDALPEWAHSVHRHVTVERPDAVAAQSGEGVGRALCTSRLGGRPELRDEVGEPLLRDGPRDPAGTGLCQLSERKQDEQWLVGRPSTVALVLA